MGFSPVVRYQPSWLTAEGRQLFLQMVRRAATRRLASPVELEYDDELSRIFTRAAERTGPDGLAPVPREVAEAVEHATNMVVGRARMRARLAAMRTSGHASLAPRGSLEAARRSDMPTPTLASSTQSHYYAKYLRDQT